MGKIEIIAVRRGRGCDTYRIRPLVEGLTKAEMIDLCDPNNWGGRVYPCAGGLYEVEVDTD